MAIKDHQEKTVLLDKVFEIEFKLLITNIILTLKIKK